jgi:hypothetical protein
LAQGFGLSEHHSRNRVLSGRSQFCVPDLISKKKVIAGSGAVILFSGLVSTEIILLLVFGFWMMLATSGRLAGARMAAVVACKLMSLKIQNGMIFQTCPCASTDLA